MKLLIFCKYAFLILTLFTLSYTVRAQNAQEVEKRLRGLYWDDSDSAEIRRTAYLLLSLDKYNEYAMERLFASYQYWWDDQPFRKQFFEKLITGDSLNPQPYYVAAQLSDSRFDKFPSKVDTYLVATIRLDSLHPGANLRLAERYYSRFVLAASRLAVDTGRWMLAGRQRWQTDSLSQYYARIAKSRFLILWCIRPYLRYRLKYPIIQLANYLHDTVGYAIDHYEEAIACDPAGMPLDSPKRYFLSGLFFALPADWRINPTYELWDLTSEAEFHIQWYSEKLAGLKESVLGGDCPPSEAYRFTWVGSFNHPLAFRIERSGKRYRLFWKAGYHLKGGEEVNTLYDTGNKNITSREWNHFKSLLTEADFWRLPTQSMESGTDGAQWLLEGVENNKYHLVDRWSPKTGAFHKCCLYLARISGLLKDMKQLY